MNKILISIEGNIGVGKSTFITLCKKYIDNIDIVYEPIDMWSSLKDENGNNILQLFYNDKNKWSYIFQNTALITRIIKIDEKITTSNKKILFLDRSVETDINIFEKMLYESKLITDFEHNVYKLYSNHYLKYINKNQTKITVYLKCSSDILIERIKKRDRTEEINIDIDYLNLLNKYHDDWLLNKNDENIIVIDCNVDFEHDIEHQQNIFKNLIENINKLTNNEIEILK